MEKTKSAANAFLDASQFNDSQITIYLLSTRRSRKKDYKPHMFVLHYNFSIFLSTFHRLDICTI